MATLLALFLSYLLLYKYIALFLIIFLSALALPAPASAMILASGAFASQGYFNFFAVAATVYVGNVVGDCVGYFLTHRYGQSVIRRTYDKHAAYFVRLEKYVRGHAALTVFVTRFAGFVGPVVNYLAGLVRMPFPVFFFADAAANLLYALGLSYIGYAVGVYWQTISSFVSIVAGIVASLIIIFFTVQISKKSRTKHTSR